MAEQNTPEPKVFPHMVISLIEGDIVGTMGPLIGDAESNLRVRLVGANGIYTTVNTPSADGVSASTPVALDVMSFLMGYNGTTFDRWRNNNEATLLASAARTATVNTADQVNYNNRGVHVIINVTATTSTPSVVPTVQGKDPVSGSYYNLLVGAAIVATGTTILKIYPGITALAAGAANDILPRTWRVNLVHADTDSITYSVGAVLVV